MKTQVFLLALLLCVVAALASPLSTAADEEPVSDSQAECIANELRQLETDLESAGELGSDALETFRRLREHRARCDAIVTSDPPSATQERMRDACRLAWSASVAYELNRLRGDSTLIDGAITAVQECRA